MDNVEHPRQTREWSAMPTSTTKASDVWVLAWTPIASGSPRVDSVLDSAAGKRKIDISAAVQFRAARARHQRTSTRRSVLLFDFHTPNGERVLIWTQ
jgi:hypothetical protein